MKDLVEIIAKSLVDHPEQIAVTETEEDGIIKIDLTVAPEDMGKVIGKQGRIAKSIRTVVKAAASKGDKKVVVGHCAAGKTPRPGGQPAAPPPV